MSCNKLKHILNALSLRLFSRMFYFDRISIFIYMFYSVFVRLYLVIDFIRYTLGVCVWMFVCFYCVCYIIILYAGEVINYSSVVRIYRLILLFRSTFCYNQEIIYYMKTVIPYWFSPSVTYYIFLYVISLLCKPFLKCPIRENRPNKCILLLYWYNIVFRVYPSGTFRVCVFVQVLYIEILYFPAGYSWTYRNVT